jgi:hypothetical protein
VQVDRFSLDFQSLLLLQVNLMFFAQNQTRDKCHLLEVFALLEMTNHFLGKRPAKRVLAPQSLLLAVEVSQTN